MFVKNAVSFVNFVRDTEVALTPQCHTDVIVKCVLLSGVCDSRMILADDARGSSAFIIPLLTLQKGVRELFLLTGKVHWTLPKSASVDTCASRKARRRDDPRHSSESLFTVMRDSSYPAISLPLCCR